MSSGGTYRGAYQFDQTSGHQHDIDEADLTAQALGGTLVETVPVLDEEP